MDRAARSAGFASPGVLRGPPRPDLRRETFEKRCRHPSRYVTSRITSLQLSPAADVAVVAGVFAAGVFFFRDKLSKPSFSQEGFAKEAGSDDPKDPEPELQQGVLGLKTLGKPDAAESPATSPTPRSRAAGAALNDFIMEVEDSVVRNGSSRLDEELAWACGQVMDCGAGGVAIFNAEGKVISSDGPLMGDDEGDAGEIVRRVSAGQKKVACDCDAGASQLPSCFNSEVVNIACLPVGDDGTVLAVASDQKGFYSSMQDRICSAVCSRLQMFVFTDSFRNKEA